MLSPYYAKVIGDGPYITVKFALALAMSLAAITPLAFLTYKLIETRGNSIGRSMVAWTENITRRRLVASAV